METCLVLAARRYDFKDEAGKQIDGITVTYITDEVQADGDTRGCQPINITAASNCWPDLVRLPAYYDLDFKQRPGPKGRPTLQLVNLQFKQAVELVQDAIS